MKSIMASRTPQDSSSSSSKRHFRWIIRRPLMDADNSLDDNKKPTATKQPVAGSRLRAILSAAIAVAARSRQGTLGPRVTGTLFGRRRGRVHLAFQADPRSSPAAVIELATPTCALVREMASGLVRIALECDKKAAVAGSAAAGGTRLVEEPVWRAYCNGRRCGFAVRRECGVAEWKVLRAVEAVSAGAGVLPDGGGDGGGDGGDGGEGEMMYMRARFERVVGSKDSEAFYMVSPDGSGGPELSIYFLRV